MNEIRPQFKGISGDTLKLIAVITMLIDHIGAFLIICYTSNYTRTGEAFIYADNIYKILRAIGRTAFPIYCFLLVEGFFHTSNIKKYLINLGVFALFSEIPFDLAAANEILEFKHQNVYFTLFLGLLMLTTMKYVFPFIGEKIKNTNLQNNRGFISYFFQVITAILFFYIASAIRCDYTFNGILLIFVFYLFYRHRINGSIIGYISLNEFFCFPAFLLIPLYNEKRKKQSIAKKYFFYIFYPFHLLMLYLLRCVIF